MSADPETLRPSRAAVWIAAARPRTLPAAVSPVVVGSALAAHDHHFDACAAALCLAFALLVQVATNFANDYYDHTKGADTAARVGPRRAVASGLVSPPTMRKAMAATFAAAFAVGLGLIHWGGPWMLAVGAASILCGVAYTGGPWPLGYHGLGDLCVFLFFGLVAVAVTYFVQTQRISADALLGGIPMGLLAANILLVNNYRDAETDAVARKRTLVVRFGRGYARVQFAASLALALAAPFAFRVLGFGIGCLLPLLLAPVAWIHLRRLRSSRTAVEQVALLGSTGRFMAAYAALFAAGILI